MNYFYFGICVVVLGGSFLCGVKTASEHYTAIISEIKSKAQSELAEAIKQKNERENVYSNTLSAVQSEAALQNEAVHKRYADLVSVGLPANGSDSADRLSESDTTSSGNSGMPDTTAAAEAVQSCNCVCPRNDKEKLQRLYERQLTVARDCDITASYYNELIKFYGTLGGVEKNTSSDSRPRP